MQIIGVEKRGQRGSRHGRHKTCITPLPPPTMHFKDYIVWVAIDGVRAEEFQPKSRINSKGTHVETCWIASSAGKVRNIRFSSKRLALTFQRFSIHFTDHLKALGETTFDLILDGHWVAGRTVHAYDHHVEHSIESTRVDTHTHRTLVFSDVEMTGMSTCVFFSRLGSFRPYRQRRFGQH